MRKADTQTPRVALTEIQSAFVASEARYPLFRGAIRSGKTVAGAVRSIARRYQWPGTWQLIGGPSWDQLRDATLTTLLGLLHPRCVAEHNHVEHRITLDNGSGFVLRSLSDPDSLRGPEWHDIWIDEVAYCGEDAFQVALGRISRPGPDGFRHSLWATTTPRGMDFTRNVWGESGQGEYAVYHATIRDNARNLPAGLIESLERRYQGTPFFDQELLGRYTAFEGLVYPMFTGPRPAPCALEECVRVVAGVDWGGITPTALILVGERASGRAHVYAELARPGLGLAEVGQQLAAWSARRKLDLVACDGSEPVAIATLRAAGFPAVAADKSRETGIRLVQERLGGEPPGLTVDSECRALVGEFGEYVWSERRIGATMVRSDTPVDHHADCLDALRYAVMALGQARPLERVALPSGRLVLAYGRARPGTPAARPSERRLPGYMGGR